MELLEPPPMQLVSFRQIILPEIGRKIAADAPFLPDVPVRKLLKTNDRPPRELHGMEEVAGSIPARSTRFQKIVLNRFR
jgi:hypothetical protein